MTDEYIGRKEVVLRIEQECEKFCPGKLCKLTEYIENAIQEIPKVDVCVQEHGVWWLEREPDGNPYCYHCSKCDLDGHFIHIRSATEYCPNCGAKMNTSFIYEYEDLTN